MAAIEQHYSIREVAEKFSITTKTVRSYIASGEIEAVRIGKTGKTVRIPESELEVFKSRYIRS